MNTPDWFSELRFAFSRKSDGQMSFKKSETELVAHNREIFFNNNTLSISHIVAGEIVHGTAIALVSRDDAGKGSVSRNWLPGVDGLVTDTHEVLLLTTHADCAPLIIYDPINRILGQAHAGWRGLASGIIKNLVQALLQVKKTDIQHLRAWIGPTIGQCCYQVNAEVAQMFPDAFSHVSNDSICLDLVGFAVSEMKKLGLESSNISLAGICTSCNPEFSSFRRDGEDFTAMACVSGLK